MSRENCPSNEHRYAYTKALGFEEGHAKYGDIREAERADKTKKDIIIKIQDLTDFENEEIFWYEARFLNRLKNLGIVPKFLDIWICDTKGYIAMDNWLYNKTGGTFKDFEHIFKKMTKEEQIDVTLDLLKLYKKLHLDAKIIHNDIRGPNLLYRQTSPGKYEFTIIDFGTSNDLFEKYNIDISSNTHLDTSEVTDTQLYKEVLEESLYEYIDLLDFLYDIGAKFLHKTDYEYISQHRLYKKSKWYCVLTDQIGSIKIKNFLSREIQDLYPDVDDIQKFYQTQLDLFNAAIIKSGSLEEGKCRKHKRKRDSGKRIKKIWKKLKALTPYGTIRSIPIPRQ